MHKPQKTNLKQNKKTQYTERVYENENASFTALAFYTNGGTGEEATHFHKVLAKKLSKKDKISIRRGNHVQSKTDFVYYCTYNTYCFVKKKKKTPINEWNVTSTYDRQPLK